MQSMSDTPSRAGPAALADRAITAWALLGGLLLVAVVLMNTYSVIGANFGAPFPGDFELTEMGVCVAAFAFLPYCQLTGANVTADIFTSGAGPRWIGIFQTLASVVALLFAALLLWRMFAGMLDQKEYGYTTAILQVPHWMAYVPVLISLALLLVASVVTLGDSVAQARGR
jgi:TRAP-type C4-dicarboxylate transport system permease small subunit